MELQGDVWVSAGTRDTYSQNGIIVWERSYGGAPILTVTRLGDNISEIASAPLSFNQSIQVEFYPQRYQTNSLTADLYTNRFNNSDWMDFQLLTARIAVADQNGTASMSVWAQMEYGGRASFLTEAEVLGDDGAQILPINSTVFDETKLFLNNDLPQFLTFTDIKLHERIAGEITSGFLTSTGVKNLLGDLE